MTNKEIAAQFKLLGNLMELHGENSFKIRSYTNAYLNLRKLPQELASMSEDEISELPGVGKAISSKIVELLTTGELKNIKKYAEITPPGIIEMLGIKGLGAKKLQVIWKELDIESIGELMYAINENRLLELKGFGAKTQKSIKEQLEYFIDSEGKQLYGRIIDDAEQLLRLLSDNYPESRFSFTGEIHRKCIIVSQIDILTSHDIDACINLIREHYQIESEVELKIFGLEINLISTTEKDFYYKLVQSSSGKTFIENMPIQAGKEYNSEEEVFTVNSLPFYIPEFREDNNMKDLDNYPGQQNIITDEDIKGCLHNHSTYSDGVNTLEEMLLAARNKSYEYFVITDHSKSAFYANGLEVERLMQQLDEIRSLDQKYDDIRFFSGIESDILSNGDLDYSDDILSELDVVIASVHSNLKMDIDKATDRLIKAIENPYTSILGHPTGRLLLSRKAYPLDFKKVIDACSNNNVAIEINANPVRLDLDWTHVQYAISKNVLISINPDAHSTKGIEDTYFGVCAARKAALPKAYCLNAFDLDLFEEWLEEQNQKR